MSCSQIPIPRIHVFEGNGTPRKDYFIAYKYKALSDYLKPKKERKFIFYEAKIFHDFLKTIIDTKASHLRIYFASYPSSGPHVPSGLERLLTLIFAPTEQHSKTDSGIYYVLNDTKHEYIEAKIASDWVGDYQENKLPILSKIIGADEKDSDTTSILYSIEAIKELRQEIECQENCSGVRIYFSSYTDDDDYNGIGKAYLKRLIIQFVLTELKGNTHKRHRDFYIEDRPDWDHRPASKRADFLDTGNPCPPPPRGCRALGALLPFVKDQ